MTNLAEAQRLMREQSQAIVTFGNPVRMGDGWGIPITIILIPKENHLKVLLSEAEVKEGVKQLADKIRSTYGEQELTIVGLMTGSIVVMADLIRFLEMRLRVGVMQTSSYRNSTESGTLQINDSMLPEIRGRNVLIVDDIFDTGKTMDRVFKVLMQHHPQSIRSAVLLLKSGKQQVEYLPDFVAFDIPDEFVVGYGLDYCDEYRNLPYIAALEPNDLKNFHS